MQPLLAAACRLLAFALAAASMAAQAHKPSDSYLSLGVDGQTIVGRWDIALRDLEFAMGLDVDGDGSIEWGEIRSREHDIAAYALGRLELAADGRTCRTVPTGQAVDDHSDGAYAVLRFRADCPLPARALAITYRLFFDLDAQHKGLLSLKGNGEDRSAIFGVASTRQEFDLGRSDALRHTAGFFREGIWHIWLGYDHVLFLVSLLLPAVLTARGSTWYPVESFRSAVTDVVKVVTAFTAAHSLTLGLATMGIVTLPSRWVESAIALSVVVAALNNIRPLVRNRRWMVAFAFGLLHGFGFASALRDVGLAGAALVPGLLGFNLGVEAGQLVIAAAVLPVAFAMREGWLYRRVVMLPGSALVALLALAWFFERAFDVKLPAI